MVAKGAAAEAEGAGELREAKREIAVLKEGVARGAAAAEREGEALEAERKLWLKLVRGFRVSFFFCEPAHSPPHPHTCRRRTRRG